MSDEALLATGYDRALADLASDKLGRSHLADQVFDALTNLPEDWSVRVGLVGAWGSGKTTIANWVKERATSEGHAVVFFAPWAAESVNELWAALAAKLDEVLTERGVKISSLSKAKIWLNNSTLTAGAKAVKDAASKVAPNYVNAGLEAAGDVVSSFNFFRMGESDLQNIAKAFGDKRIIVMVDDLDRTDPKLIPKTLMALRELLDKSNFSFLLPFDEEIVLGALKEYNASWGQNASFLDKIFDFRVTIVPPSPSERWNLFQSEMNKAAKFVPLEDIAAIASHLPPNPRRIKGIARQFRLFEPEASRHRSSEIDWPSICYSLILRSYSVSFFKEFVGELDENPKSEFWSIGNYTDRDQKKQKLSDHIDQMLAELAFEGLPNKDDIKILCLQWRKDLNVANYEQAVYSVKILDRSGSFTWSEFDAIYDRWVADPGIDLASEIEKYATSHRGVFEIVLMNVIDCCVATYSGSLRGALSEFFPEDYVKSINESRKILEFQRGILLSLPDAKDATIDHVEILKKLYAQASALTSASLNKGDKDLRDLEEAVLIDYAKLHPEAAGGFLLGLVDHMDDPLSEITKSRGFARTIVDQLIELVTPDLIFPMREPEGVKKLFPDNNRSKSKEALLDPKSRLWDHGDQSRMHVLLRSASRLTFVQRNAHELLYLMYAISKNPGAVSPEIANSWLSEDRMLEALWQAALVRPLQAQQWYKAHAVRAHFQERGSKASMPDPPWVAAEIPALPPIGGP